jgi:hypothetical protein
MKEAIEDSGRGGALLEQLSPVFDRSIGRYEGAFSGSIAIEDDIEQIVGPAFRGIKGLSYARTNHRYTVRQAS